jgi:FlaA1/EpsC-like NDP-sugar epimerase
MNAKLLNIVQDIGIKHAGLVSIVLVFIGIIASVISSYLLRFDFDFDEVSGHHPGQLLIPALVIKGVVVWRMKLFHGWWRYASLADVVKIFKATVYSSLFLTLFVALAYRLEGVPRSVLILDAVLTFSYLAGVRFCVRLFREIYLPVLGTKARNKYQDIIIIGAGEAGQSVVREIRKSAVLEYNVIGFLDDDPLKKKLSFQGVPVLGAISTLERIIAAEPVERVIVAIPGATGREMRRIVEFCNDCKVRIQTLPGIADLIDGRVSIQQVRDVHVRDLLGRRAVELDIVHIGGYLAGKRILVTGAAGSIGSELCRQIVKYSPKELVLFDIAESPLFFLDNELKGTIERLTPIIGDVRDESLVDHVFKTIEPEIVFHAAAYKHVPMMELHPRAAVDVNMKGTKVVADAADQHHALSFVMISTDKAVRPTNVMGATKRAAEVYIQDLNRRSSTAFMTVRFGNVLDSAGSVIPIFRAQIKSGGPVTVTHPDVTRFFMTIPEASQLVLQSASMGQGGEIFLLDMGEAVKISFLAEEMIRLSGFTPHEDIEIVYSGLRPGEKLYEELLLAGEDVLPTNHAAIRVAAAEKIRVVEYLDRYALMIGNLGSSGADEIKRGLIYLVPEYTSQSIDENQQEVS